MDNIVSDFKEIEKETKTYAKKQTKNRCGHFGLKSLIMCLFTTIDRKDLDFEVYQSDSNFRLNSTVANTEKYSHHILDNSLQ